MRIRWAESAARIGEIRNTHIHCAKIGKERPPGMSKNRRHNIKSNNKEIRECSSKKYKGGEFCSGLVNSVNLRGP